MKRLGKNLVIVFIAFVLASPLFAASAKVTFVKGKAEVLKNDAWVALNTGDTVEMSDTISTGFQSEVKIEYGGSVMSLGALTRITLENLSTTSSKENVSVYLKTGTVRSKVTHTQEKRVSYNVKSPVAVCSVRGTEFIVRADGLVNCLEGAVAVYANTSVEYEFASNDAEVSSEESEEDGESSEENPGDYPPANPTTPAEEISEDAPAGAIVVGKDQTVEFKNDGNPETPLVYANKNSTTIKNTVSTAADKEAVVVGGSSSVVPEQVIIILPDVETAENLEDFQNKVRGSIKATVRFED